ncbi:MAG TPA: chemotaxis protein CheC [Gemmatimonadales bacterium]|nr:chemotaxis protein CheC [Gemmatimonadales bacterium]
MSRARQSLPANMDILREVANVAAAHAATALSQLTDRTIMITVPDLLLAPLTEVPGSLAAYAHNVLSVEMRILGQVQGRILYMMPQRDARFLADFLLGRASLQEDSADGLTESCLQETANILGGAYTSALARMTGRDVMLSVPRLRVGDLLDLLAGTGADDPTPDEYAFCVATSFHLGAIHPELEGRLLLVSDSGSLATLIEAVRITAGQV